MTQIEFVEQYHEFLRRPIFGGHKPTDDELKKLYAIIINKFGDVPSDFFAGTNNMAMGYLSNLDYVLGREPKEKHIHEWLYEMGLWA